MEIENYNIHNIIRFQLANRNLKGLFNDFNPEYEYFLVKEDVDPDFRITIANEFNNTNNKNIKYKFNKNYKKWNVEIIEYEHGFIDIYIVPKLTGFRRHMKYFTLKTIYIRSLIYYCLIRKGGTLIHSSGVNINNKAFLFVGRPGVFKTSLLMDIIKNTNATFLGEENTFLYNGKIYPFPFHYKSLLFRIKHYQDENPQTLFHKYWQVFSLFLPSKMDIPISKPIKLDTIFYVEKQQNYSCSSTKLSRLHDKLVKNEIEELNVKCNHRLSANIADNFFTDFLIENQIMYGIEKLLGSIFQKELKYCYLYDLKMPSKYQHFLYNKILNE